MRAALRSAIHQQNRFEYGSLFVNLAPLSGRDQIIMAVADGLGFVLHAALDRSTQLITNLGDKEFLLDFDNFEHLLSEAGSISLPGDLLKMHSGSNC